MLNLNPHSPRHKPLNTKFSDCPKCNARINAELGCPVCKHNWKSEIVRTPPQKPKPTTEADQSLSLHEQMLDNHALAMEHKIANPQITKADISRNLGFEKGWLTHIHHKYPDLRAEFDTIET